MSHVHTKGRRVRLLASLMLLAGTAVGASAEVQWKSQPDRRLSAMTPAQVSETLQGIAAHAPGAAKQRVVMTFERPIDDAERQKLRTAGIELLSYLSGNSYFASIQTAQLDARAAGQIGIVSRVRPVQRAWKLHPDLNAGRIQPWSIVGAEEPGLEGAKNPTVAAYLVFHKDVDVNAEGIEIAERHGAQIVSAIDWASGLVIELPYENIKALADEDAVMWVEPPAPQFSELNQENRETTGANIVQEAPYGLTGQGVTVFVYDGGSIRTTHQDFQGRATNIDTDAVSDHATHVSGTIGGGGVADPTEKGMAPGVLLVNAGFEWDGSNTFLYQNPGDMVADYTLAINTHGADISNNSIGNNTEPNGFPCEWQGDYGFVDTVIDGIARGSVSGGTPFRLVWAAGNERQGSRCDVEGFGDYFSSGPPANAKNQICVGALNALTDTMTTFSSWGPSDDGRMRPDISAPGCQSGGDNGVRSAGSASDTAYTSKCGTSMASPTVCGLSALVLEDFRNRYPSQPDPRNSMLKVWWMHTAVDILNPGPDYQSGYGSVRVEPAVNLVRSGNFASGEVAQGGSYFATVIVNPGDTELKVTIAWDDPAGTPNVNPTLVNDLDLIVRSPGGVQAFPWTLDPAVPSANAVRTQRNFRDNNEQVLVNNPEPGAWSVEVRGFNVPQGPQPFSLAATPFLVNCASRGTAGLDQGTYRCDQSTQLTVTDCDLNTSDSVVDTVLVTLASTSDPLGFQVLLTETAAQSAAFRASVPLVTSPSVGSLLVASGDVITMTYQDADTGGGSSATVSVTAGVDCVAPAISNVAVSNIGTRTATITFATNEAARPTVRYGTACGTFSASSSGAPSLNHSFNLSGLTDGTIYYFQVEAADGAGNAVSDNNGGACYTFTTADIPDFYTQLFSATSDPNDTDNRTIQFTPENSIQGYSACSQEAFVLPNDPTLGLPLTLPADDSSQEVVLTGGQTVKLFGVSYSSVWVNANGNLTFGSGDADATESTTDHFNRPRISALFDDLDPSEGGQYTYQQLSDRLVVSFVNAPQDAVVGDQNTFQYELFFDGRIRLTFLAIGAGDGLTGISRGGGQSPDFIESNINSYGFCNPIPPRAIDGVFGTPLDDNLSITLQGADDGRPNPPADLQFIITSLPANGRLIDPNGGTIFSVPYTLAASGNVVSYDPNCTFVGADSFQFKCNDFGTFPDGGDSNIATVSIDVGVPEAFLTFLVQDVNPRWTMTGSWAFGQPLGQGGSSGGGSGSPDPSAGFTGLNVVGYNLAGNYVNSMPEFTATTQAISTLGRTGVVLRFQRWLGVERSQYDFARIQVSVDNSTWTTVFVNSVSTSLNPNGQWTQVSYDISALADNKPSVYVRWTMGPTDSSVLYCGWNIDDVEFLADPLPPPPCPFDVTADCSVNFADITFILENWGVFNFGNITSVLENWGVTCNQ